MRTYQMTCLMILLWLALVAVADEQAETPPMREITSAEITRFLNDPSGAKIEGHLAVIPKTEAGIQGAGTLAESVMWADTATNFGQAIGLVRHFHCFEQIAFCN